MFGTEGQAIVEDLEGTTLDVRIGRASSERIEVAPRSAATHRPVVEDFARALWDADPVRCSGADAVRSSLIIELAYRAARERRTLDVPAGALPTPH